MSEPSPPRQVLLRHISRMLTGRVVLCSLVLVSLLEILGLLEQTTPILSRHLGFQGILTYALLRLPGLIVQALPLSVMIGALFMLLQMSTHSEIASLRAAGLSTVALFGLMLPATLTLGASAIVLKETVNPRSELALARWWNKTAPDDADDSRSLWFHLGPDLVHAGAIKKGASVIAGLTMYHRKAGGELASVSEAESAHYEHDGWHGTHVKLMTLHPTQVMTDLQDTALMMPPSVSPGRIIQLAEPYPVLSTWDIEKIIHYGAPASLPKATYRMALYEPYILPLSLCAMLLLTLPVVYIPPRAGTRSLLPIASLGAGFGYIMLQGMIQALGNAGTLPAPLAIITAPVLALLLGGAWLLKMEEK